MGSKKKMKRSDGSFRTGRRLGKLIIPKALKRAAIIDGQHRLFGFNFAQNSERLQMPLASVSLSDLPKPYQARLFATINANQRPVNKSQTYELFGYNMEEEPAEKWTPEKLAVFLARKLNVDKSSPFHEHIVVPAENDFSTSLAVARREGGWGGVARNRSGRNRAPDFFQSEKRCESHGRRAAV